MKYRLYIRPVRVDDHDAPQPWEEVDLGDEQPAMTYQVNNLNELKDRNATYSQRIRLPRNNRNCMALGFVDHFNVVSDAAYDPLEALLTCDDVYLSPVGARLQIESVSTAIECQIVSPAYDLFKALDKSIPPMADWAGFQYSLQQLEQDYRVDTHVPIDWPDASVKHRWPLLFNRKGVPPQRKPGFYDTVDFYGLVPCVQFLDFVRFTFRREGFRFQSDLIDHSEAEKDYLTCSSLQKSSDGVPPALWIGRVTVPGSSYQEAIVSPPLVVTDALQLCEGVRGNETMRFCAPNPGTYAVLIRVDNSEARKDLSGMLSYTLTHRVYGDSGYVASGLYSDRIATGVGTGYVYTYSPDPVSLATRDQIELTITCAASTAAKCLPQIEFSVLMAQKEDDAAVSVGQEGDYLRDTGFKTSLEGIQAFIRAYGVLVDVKRYAEPVQDDMFRMPWLKGEVQAYTFGELYRRRDNGIYLDWSGKLAVGESDEQFSFTVGNYAQNNRIELAENSDDGFTDAAFFAVNNRTLPAEKTLFTVPVEAGRDMDGIASVPLMAASEETTPNEGTRSVWTFEGGKPHLVRIDDAEYLSTGIVQGNNYGYDKQGYPDSVRGILIARHRPMAYLVENYYKNLAGMLHDAKSIRVGMYLDPTDIEQLDFFTPIYIDHFGAYFYLSKISNFVAGKTTICELVKL